MDMGRRSGLNQPQKQTSTCSWTQQRNQGQDTPQDEDTCIWTYADVYKFRGRPAGSYPKLNFCIAFKSWRKSNSIGLMHSLLLSHSALWRASGHRSVNGGGENSDGMCPWPESLVQLTFVPKRPSLKQGSCPPFSMVEGIYAGGSYIPQSVTHILKGVKLS